MKSHCPGYLFRGAVCMLRAAALFCFIQLIWLISLSIVEANSYSNAVRIYLWQCMKFFRFSNEKVAVNRARNINCFALVDLALK